MFTTFESDSLAIMPVSYHPTTILMVDDDPSFSKQLAGVLSQQFPILTFNDSEEAIQYFDKNNEFFLKNKRELHASDLAQHILNIRKQVYNPNRFKEIIISVIDYEMPNKSGFDVIKNMGATSIHLNTVLPPSYILLTGKRYSEFDEELAQSPTGKNYISKRDPDYADKVIQAIRAKSAFIFQWQSYELASTLARDPIEQSNFLFDGNFLPLLNAYIDKHKICEIYIFDRQGSLLFLDKQGRLSWLFVRNDAGMQQSIKLAEQHQAPSSVIKALQSKQVLLSLYEQEDINSKKSIDWDNYMLPANQFESDDKYTKYFNLKLQSPYYYTFTDQFPKHGIQEDKIVPYASFYPEQ